MADIKRLPLSVNYGPRDSSRTKDERMINCYAEQGASEQTFAVKRPGLLINGVMPAGIAQGVFLFSGTTFAITNDTLVSGPGSIPVADGSTYSNLGGTKPTANLIVHSPTVVVDGSGNFVSFRYNIGSNTVFKDSSSDGVNWTSTATTGFPGNNQMNETSGLVFFGGKFYLYGGSTAGGTALSTVYSSADGVTWTLNTNSAGFGNLKWMGVVVAGSTVFVGGGFDGSLALGTLYKSTDGVSFSSVTISTAFTARYHLSMLSYNSALWIIGGRFQDGTYVDDVWSSVDNGANWVRQTTSMGSANISNYVPFQATVYNNFMWVIAGNATPSSQMLRSSSGVTWTQLNGGLPGSMASGTEVGLSTGLGSFVYFDTAGVAFKSVLNSGGGTSYSLSPSVAGGKFDFTQASIAAGQNGFFFKSTTNAYFFNNAVLTKVTDVNYPATTVPGVAYLDGTYYVMTPSGAIRGSNLEDPTKWNPLNTIQANAEPDGGVAIARILNYVVGFGVYTTEFFYDAGNVTGSPLARIDNALLEVGCAAARSIATCENTIFFMGVSKQKGRSIYKLTGTAPEKVSSPFVDRVLLADDLANVFSFAVRVNGHTFYILTLKTTGVTLVYDMNTKLWHEWTSSVAQNAQTISAGHLTSSGGVATVVLSNHGFSDGDPVDIAGAVQTQYNGRFSISLVDSNTFTYPISGSPASPATGTITATGYTTQYFQALFYAGVGNFDLVQDETSGNVYTLDQNTYTDNLLPLDVKIITPKWDGGSVKKKFFSELNLVADKISSTAYVRYSDDDYSTWTLYRALALASTKSRVVRLGSSRRRAYEIRHVDSTAFRAEAIELIVDEGVI